MYKSPIHPRSCQKALVTDKVASRTLNNLGMATTQRQAGNHEVRLSLGANHHGPHFKGLDLFCLNTFKDL
jgi:hypothetical protein